MSMYPVLSLKPDKVATVAFRHPWIFSGAMEKRPADLQHGSLVHVADSHGKILGTGTFSNRGSISVRVFEFDDAVIDQKWFEKKLREAQTRRAAMGYGPGTDTTGYRILFGESDSIPGLVIDRYEDLYVMQLSTAGIDQLRQPIIEAIMTTFKPSVLVERSDISTRHEEGLEEVKTVHHGDCPDTIEFRENGLRFLADPMSGQKTGFYLDQKDLRSCVRHMAEKMTVLNLFSNTGSFSVAALKAGAKQVHQIDSSQPALEATAALLALNELDPSLVTYEAADVFQWLGKNTQRTFDMVICDPPALIKSQRDIESGRKAYHFLNRAALRLVNHGGIFVTSSCSNYLNEDDFAFNLRRAATQAGVVLDVLRAVRQSPDHPLSVYFAEALYLKSFVFQVRYQR
jgi:23S rRNA (cytosine1962-C5)-methyltransferase